MIRLAFYAPSKTLDLLKNIAPTADIEKTEHFLQFTKELVPVSIVLCAYMKFLNQLFRSKESLYIVSLKTMLVIFK